MARNLKGLSKSIANKKSNLKSKGISVDKLNDIVPNGYSKLTIGEQKRILNKLNKLSNKNTVDVVNKSVNKSVNKKSYTDYDRYLKKTGLNGDSISKQKFNDIKQVLKLTRNIRKNLDVYKNALSKNKFEELENQLKRFPSRMSDYIKNTNAMLLKASMTDFIDKFENRVNDHYLNEIITRKGLGVTDEEYNNLIKRFNNLSMTKRIKLNAYLMNLFFQKYEDAKMQGIEFYSYDTLMSIIDTFK